MDEMCDEKPDIVLICCSILSTETMVRSIPLHKLKPDTIFVDVLSVKQFPRNLFLEKHLEESKDSPIAVLFSGGLDSMILAALLDQCLDPRCIIDLLNVSFDGQLAPDRVSARIGVKELQYIAPSRRWRLVEIDTTLSSLSWETKHVMSLIHPAKTYMDLNIGIALWLAAKGDGWVDGEICNNLQSDRCRYQYRSTSGILLVGSDADEQCAGYGRHKTKYRNRGWAALQEEMRLPFVYEAVRVSEGEQARKCARFFSVFEKEGCRMVYSRLCSL